MENETLIIYNFQGVACDTKFRVCDIAEISVFDRSGDEVVCIKDKDLNKHLYDSADMAGVPRRNGTIYHGGFLLYDKEDIRNWIENENRKADDSNPEDKRNKPNFKTLNAKHAVKIDDPGSKEPTDEEFLWFMEFADKHNVKNRLSLLSNYSKTGNPFK